MTEQRPGILGDMGRPTRLVPRGDPGDLVYSGQMNCSGTKALVFGQNAWGAALAASDPMPQHDRRDGYA